MRSLLLTRWASPGLDVVLQSGEEALDAGVPLLPDHHRVEQLADGPELELVLHALAHRGSRAVRSERVAVLQPTDRQRALEELERHRLVRLPFRDPLLEPAARLQVASTRCPGSLSRRRDDLRLQHAGIVAVERVER